MTWLRFTARRRRRGITVILVLGLLSLTVAVSYALVRSQTMSAQLNRNGRRLGNATDAAQTGLLIALRKMHESGWAGVTVPIVESLSADHGFEVRFETGDAALVSSDPDYAEYPFRITLISTGWARDPAEPQLLAETERRAVVQLVRRALSPAPGVWSSLQNATLIQWSDARSRMSVPGRIAGPVQLGGELELCKDYPQGAAAREQYLADLERMRADGLPDYRPFTGPIQFPLGEQDATVLDLLGTHLNVPLVPGGAGGNPPVTHPGTVSDYQLYPGGVRYTIPDLVGLYGSTLTDVTVGPDMESNPLGVFSFSSPLQLNDRVRVDGVLIATQSSANLQIQGTDVDLNTVDLPPVRGATTPVQLPMAIAAGDVDVGPSAACDIRGMLMSWRRFRIEEGDDGAVWSHRGRLLVDELAVNGRARWKLTSGQWSLLLTSFLAQKDDVAGIRYFPVWLQAIMNFQAQPLLTLQPDSGVVQYHWHPWDQPLYQPAATDAGLHWEVVRWQP